MGERYSASPDKPYEALRSGHGFVELQGWSSVTVTGADRQTFLNNFCTNDVKRLSPGDSCEAFITNVKGKIVGHGLVSCRDSKLVIIGTPQQAEWLIPHLDRYIIREDVKLVDSTKERAYLLTTNLEADPKMIASRWDLLGPVECRLVEVSRGTLPLIRQQLLARELVESDLAAFDTLRIEAGTPLFGVDFNEQNFPQEVGRDRQAISFTKGCYLGQETVARIDALGHVNRRLVGVKFDGATVPTSTKDLFHNGATVGHITSATFSPQLGAPLALAMARREHNAPGCRLESAVGACEVIELPVAGPR